MAELLQASLDSKRNNTSCAGEGRTDTAGGLTCLRCNTCPCGRSAASRRACRKEVHQRVQPRCPNNSSMLGTTSSRTWHQHQGLVQAAPPQAHTRAGAGGRAGLDRLEHDVQPKVVRGQHGQRERPALATALDIGRACDGRRADDPHGRRPPVGQPRKHAVQALADAVVRPCARWGGGVPGCGAPELRVQGASAGVAEAMRHAARHQADRQRLSEVAGAPRALHRVPRSLPAVRALACMQRAADARKRATAGAASVTPAGAPKGSVGGMHGVT